MEEHQEDYFTVPQLARRWRVKSITIRRWIADGVIAPEQVTQGKRVHYHFARDRRGIRAERPRSAIISGGVINVSTWPARRRENIAT
jgi:hypothetical protein